MKKLKDLYDEKYLKIALYVICTLLITFVLGMIIYNLSGSTKSAFSLLGSVLSPLVLGLVIAYLFSPLVEWFEKKVFAGIRKEKTRRALGVAATFILVILVIILILSALIITVTKSISAIDFNDLLSYVQSLENDLSSFWKVVEERLADLNIDLGQFGPKISKIFNNVSSGASTLLFANIFAIYFLLDAKIGEYWSDILNLFTSPETREKIRSFAADADRVFSGYIRGQSIDALLIGIMVAVAMQAAGIPYAVVIGLLTGIGNLIPYVGPVVGFGSMLIVTLSEGSLTHMITGAIVLMIVMTIDGNIINPKLLSDNVEIHPVLVILALIAGGQIGGIIGMLVAVPVGALLKLQFEKFIARRKLKLENKEETVQ